MTRKAGVVVTSDAIVAYNAQGVETHRVILRTLTPYEAAREVKEDEAETYLSWTDDGVILQCERKECMTEDVPLGHSMWYQEDLPFKLTPQMAQAAYNAHLARHTS